MKGAADRRGRGDGNRWTGGSHRGKEVARPLEKERNENDGQGKVAGVELCSHETN